MLYSIWFGVGLVVGGAAVALGVVPLVWWIQLRTRTVFVGKVGRDGRSKVWLSSATGGIENVKLAAGETVRVEILRLRSPRRPPDLGTIGNMSW